MGEAIKCFGYLAENIPEWIGIIDSLEQKIKERQLEISRVPVPTHKLKKTGSNESIRPKANSEERPSQTEAEITSAPQARDVAQAPTSRQLLAAQRKRKTTSVLSNESGPNKSRSRSMIIVYYDSEIQEAFEKLVRNIGIGRNQIRKARMASRMEALTGDASDALLRVDRSRTGYAPMAMFRTARGPGPRPNPLADVDDSPTDAFGTTDAALEKAQSLCEKGAHQFLRDGGCEAETSGARESFVEVLDLSKSELVKLKEEADRRQREKEEAEKHDEKAEVDKVPASNAVEISGPGMIIEADDNNDDEEAMLDMEQIRLMSRRRRNMPNY
jgi:hypothetical protein